MTKIIFFRFILYILKILELWEVRAYMNQLKGKSKINVVALEGKGYCLAEFGSTAVTESYPWV